MRLRYIMKKKIQFIWYSPVYYLLYISPEKKRGRGRDTDVSVRTDVRTIFEIRFTLKFAAFLITIGRSGSRSRCLWKSELLELPEFPHRSDLHGSAGENFKRGKSRAIGPEVKLDFVLPERCKNLKREGKRGQTSLFPVSQRRLVLVRFLFLSGGPVVESANLFEGFASFMHVFSATNARRKRTRSFT